LQRVVLLDDGRSLRRIVGAGGFRERVAALRRLVAERFENTVFRVGGRIGFGIVA